MKASLVAVVLSLSRVAAAEPSPPAPILMPALAPHHRLTAATALAVGPKAAAYATLSLAGSVVHRDLEAFAEISATGVAVYCDSECDGSEGFRGNPRIGARYHVHVGEVIVAPSVTGWIPITTAPEVLMPGDGPLGPTAALARGLDDSRALVPVPAAAVGVAVARQRERSFVEAELGAALVIDDGVQVDNVFGAVGAGVRPARTVWLAELRIDAYPKSPVMTSLGLAVGRQPAPGGLAWRFRVHPGFRGDDFALALALDATWTWR